MKLTNEQIIIAEENQMLIMGFLNSKKLNESEWYGIIAESYLKAIMNHDSSRGQLSTLFYTIAKNDWIKESMSKQTFRDRNNLGWRDSIENEYSHEPYASDNYFEDETYNLYMSRIDKLDGRHKVICNKLMDGISVSSIAESLGLSRMTIYRDIDKIKQHVVKQGGNL